MAEEFKNMFQAPFKEIGESPSPDDVKIKEEEPEPLGEEFFDYSLRLKRNGQILATGIPGETIAVQFAMKLSDDEYEVLDQDGKVVFDTEIRRNLSNPEKLAELTKNSKL